MFPNRFLFAIVFLFCCHFVPAKSLYAFLPDPTPSVTLHMQQVPLLDILLEIEKQTGIFFSYESSLPADFQRVSLKVKDESLSYCLRKLFDPLPITYRLSGQYVILKRKPRMYTVSGFVRDSSSFESLINATIVEHSSGLGTVSNNYGFYSITLAPGKIRLSSSYVGYETYSVSFNLTKDTLLDLPLKPSGMLEEVVIQKLSPRSESIDSRAGAVDVPVGKIKTLPALLGEADVAKTLQRLPGTTMGADGMTNLYVRGGEGDDNLFLLDGNPVYNTGHVLGFFSAFNPDAVKNATFYKNSFPSAYGGRLSSVIDVRTNEGDRKEYHGNASIGLLALRANLEGPIIKDRSAFNISVRRTWTELISWPLLTYINKGADKKIKGGYHFYDMNAKVDYSFSARSRAYLSFFMGTDSYGDGAESKYQYGENRDFRWRWGNLIASAGWNYLMHPKLFASFTGGYTRYRSHIIRKQNNFISSKETGNRFFFQEGHFRSAMEDVSLRASFDYRPNMNHRIRMGEDYLFHVFRPEHSTLSSWYTDSLMTKKNSTVFAHSQIYGHEMSLYAEDEMVATERLRMNMGIRTTFFYVQKHLYHSFQPRFSARYLIGQDLSVKASFSKMNQYVHLLSNSEINQPTDIWVPVTGKIRPMNAFQLSGGVFWKWKNLHFSIESYYKRIGNLMDYQDNAPEKTAYSGWEDRVSIGKGRAYGMELMVQKQTGRLSGWLAYTLSYSDRWYPDGTVNKGRRFPSHVDNRHKIDLVTTFKISPTVELTTAWMYKSGNYITIQDMYYRSGIDRDDQHKSLGFYTEYDRSASARNNYRLSPYHRLDLGVNIFRFKPKGRVGIWNISLCNAYLRPNPFMVRPLLYFDSGKRNVFLEQTVLFLFVPSLSYTYKF